MKDLRPGSLQMRLALSLAAVYLVATAIGVVALLYQAYSTADALSKEDLNRKAKHLAALTTRQPDGSPLTRLPDWLDALYRSGAFMHAVHRPDGALVTESTKEVGDLVARLSPATAEPQYFRLKNFGEARKDYFGLTVSLESAAGPLRVTVARAADDDVLVGALLREFVFNTAWLVPLMVIGTLAIGVWALRLGFRPLREVSAKAAAIEPGTLSERLPEAGVPSEIRPLVAAMNHALDRLEKGFAVQRQFTADAAHELRTPLAILTAGLEQLGADPKVMKLRKDAERMNRLVEQLLRVARLDALALDVSEQVDLGTAARNVAGYLAPLAIAQHRSIAVQAPHSPVVIRGHRHAIEDAIRNLVENALSFTPANSEVVLSVEPPAVIHVLDRGPGVRPEDRERIFNRFWRGKGSPGSGSGLGLAIVSEIMKAHGGTVRVSDNDGAGAAFSLTFRSTA